jgi:hypothetical protein
VRGFGGAATQASVSNASAIKSPAAGHNFHPGETFTYSAEWRLWNAGTATIQITSAGGEQHIHAAGDSSGAVTLLYRVHDRFDAYFDPRSFCSLHIQKHIEEGMRRRDTQIAFDYSSHQAMLNETNLRSGEKKQEKNEIPGCATDVISGLFYAASLPLENGATYMFPLNDGGKTVDVSLAVQGREEVKTPAGTFRAIKVEPSAPSGVLKNKGHIWIWYSDDDQRIPVQARARMTWGTVTFRLTKVDKGANVSAGSQ